MNFSFYQGGYMALSCQRYSGIIKACPELQMTFSAVLRKNHMQGTDPWMQGNTALLAGCVHEVSTETSYNLHLLLCPILLQGHGTKGVVSEWGNGHICGPLHVFIHSTTVTMLTSWYGWLLSWNYIGGRPKEGPHKHTALRGFLTSGLLEIYRFH